MNNVRPICSGATQQKTEILELVAIMNPLVRPIGILNTPWQNQTDFILHLLFVKICIIWFFSYTGIRSGIWKTKKNSKSLAAMTSSGRQTKLQKFKRQKHLTFQNEVPVTVSMTFHFRFSLLWKEVYPLWKSFA